MKSDQYASKENKKEERKKNNHRVFQGSKKKGLMSHFLAMTMIKKIIHVTLTSTQSNKCLFISFKRNIC